MKSKSIFHLGKAALLGSCALLLANLQALATEPFSLSACGIGATAPGQFSCLAIFTLNCGTGDANFLSGNATVQGGMAVAGSGKITMSNFSRIEGNLSYKTNGTLTRVTTPPATNNPIITGSIFKNASTDSLLNVGAVVAPVASSLVDSLPASTGYPSTINLTNSTLSLTSPGVAVLKLTDFRLSNSTLTLNGGASSYFLINVKKDFSLTGTAGNPTTTGSKVLLSGGLTWDHVLFNVRGSSGLAKLSGTSELNGILLATSRTVTMTDSSKLSGAIVANTVNLSGNSLVKCPMVSP